MMTSFLSGRTLKRLYQKKQPSTSRRQRRIAYQDLSPNHIKDRYSTSICSCSFGVYSYQGDRPIERAVEFYTRVELLASNALWNSYLAD